MIKMTKQPNSQESKSCPSLSWRASPREKQVSLGSFWQGALKDFCSNARGKEIIMYLFTDNDDILI
jgi:hypothetical protein